MPKHQHKFCFVPSVKFHVTTCVCTSGIFFVSKPFIEIRDGLHPCVVTTYSGDEFIPNDLVMCSPTADDSHRPLVLVTGPNMGGKSTLMRQTALICMLAQLVCGEEVVLGQSYVGSFYSLTVLFVNLEILAFVS